MTSTTVSPDVVFSESFPPLFVYPDYDERSVGLFCDSDDVSVKSTIDDSQDSSFDVSADCVFSLNEVVKRWMRTPFTGRLFSYTPIPIKKEPED